MMIDIQVEQVFIAIFGVTAIFLSQDRRYKFRKLACFFGLLAQPFWFYTTFQSEQWGIFCLCFLYLYSWIRGFYNYWINPQLKKGNSDE